MNQWIIWVSGFHNLVWNTIRFQVRLILHFLSVDRIRQTWTTQTVLQSVCANRVDNTIFWVGEPMVQYVGEHRDYWEPSSTGKPNLCHNLWRRSYHLHLWTDDLGCWECGDLWMMERLRDQNSDQMAFHRFQVLWSNVCDDVLFCDLDLPSSPQHTKRGKSERMSEPHSRRLQRRWEMEFALNIRNFPSYKCSNGRLDSSRPRLPHRPMWWSTTQEVFRQPYVQSLVCLESRSSTSTDCCHLDHWWRGTDGICMRSCLLEAASLPCRILPPPFDRKEVDHGKQIFCLSWSTPHKCDGRTNTFQQYQ